jgi:hypothetical protein
MTDNGDDGNAPSRRLTLSVRTLMLLAVAIAAWLGWITHKAREQWEAVPAVKSFGGQDHRDVRACSAGGASWPRRFWIRRKP